MLQPSDCWFFDLTEAQCVRAGVDTGDCVSVGLRQVSTGLPRELLSLLEVDATAKRVWTSLTAARQRIIAEHVRGAKRSETRMRRATRALTTDNRPQLR